MLKPKKQAITTQSLPVLTGRYSQGLPFDPNYFASSPFLSALGYYSNAAVDFAAYLMAGKTFNSKGFE